MRKLFGMSPGNAMEWSGLGLVCAAGTAASFTIHGFLGFYLRILPPWTYGFVASLGGVLFFLGPMLFGQPQLSSRGVAGLTSSSKLLLYLRPFDQDLRGVLQLLVGATMGPVLYLTVLQTHWWILSLILLHAKLTDEQELQYAFGAFGHLVAFRQPGRRSDPIGALRYRAEGDWRKELTRLLGFASVVIIQPGRSESIQWEIREALRRVPPKRIVFYLRFPGDEAQQQRAYEVFRIQMRALLPVELPVCQGRARYLVIGRDWEPLLYAPGNHPRDLLRYVLSGDPARERLRPVFAALGEEFAVEPLTFKQKLHNLVLWHSPAVTAAVLTLAALAIDVVLPVLLR
ncbi:MAG: hypothetical protein AB1941_00445 [Gemmatimonadota bacterium]